MNHVLGYIFHPFANSNGKGYEGNDHLPKTYYSWVKTSTLLQQTKGASGLFKNCAFCAGKTVQYTYLSIFHVYSQSNLTDFTMCSFADSGCPTEIL